jgi:hypothetical protein
MIDFILWVALIGTALCALVMLTLIVTIIVSVADAWRRHKALRGVLPPPDKAADRTYGLNYFYRANGKK